MSDEALRMTEWRPLYDGGEAAIVEDYRDCGLGVGRFQRVLVRVEHKEGKDGPLLVALQYVPEDTPAHPASSKVREIIHRTFPDIFR